MNVPSHVLRDSSALRYCIAAVGAYCLCFGLFHLLGIGTGGDLGSAGWLVSANFLICGFALVSRATGWFYLSVLFGFVLEYLALVLLLIRTLDYSNALGLPSAALGNAGAGIFLSFLLAGIAIQFISYKRAFRIRSAAVAMCGSTVLGFGLVSLANAVAGIGQESIWQCLAFIGTGAYLTLAAWNDPTRSPHPIWFNAAVGSGSLTANIVLWQGLSNTVVETGNFDGFANAVFYAGLLAACCLTLATHFAQSAYARATALAAVNAELLEAYEATLAGWASALELRDNETKNHTLRVTELTTRLARRFSLSESEIVHIHRGALLHDIGKLGIPDSILLKNGPLNPEEWAIMKRHPEYAVNMLKSIPYLHPALDIPRYHHEKWDGTGYPEGLAGSDIPLAARLFAVVDVWDALTSDRPYRSALPVQEVINHIQSQADTHFDPAVVRDFLEMIRDDHGYAGRVRLDDELPGLERGMVEALP